MWYPGSGQRLRCLKCSDISDPNDCVRIITCGSSEAFQYHFVHVYCVISMHLLPYADFCQNYIFKRLLRKLSIHKAYLNAFSLKNANSRALTPI